MKSKKPDPGVTSYSIEGGDMYRVLFEIANDGILIVDADTGGIVDANPSLVRLLGCSFAQLTGRKAWEPELLKEIFPSRGNFFELTRQGFVRHEEIRLVTSDGRRIDVDFKSTVSEVNSIKLVQCTLRDVSDAKRAEESQRMLTKALEATANGVAITDVSGDILWVNEAFTTMTGYSRKEVLGRNPRILKSGNQDHRLYKDLWNTISRGNVWHGELINKRKDGSLYTDEMTITPLTNPKGEVIRFIAIKQDVTERKEANRALLESVHRFRAMFDDAPIGYHEIDTQGRIVEVNSTELGMLGYTAEEMIGHKAHEFIIGAEVSRKSIEGQLAGSIPSGGIVERTFRRKDGSSLSVLVSNRTIHTSSGEITGVRSALQDITSRKEGEHQLRLLAQTLACTRDCISITDLDDNILFVNRAFEATYGYGAEELVGKNIAIVRSPLNPPSLSTRINPETMSSGWHGEIVNRRKDGTDFSVELWTSLVKNDEGVSVAMVGVARDITDRQLSESQIRQSEQQFRLIAENVADMIAVLDPDGRRLYNSPSYRMLFGDTDALKGTSGFREIHPDDVARVKQVFEETVRTGTGQRLEYRFLLKDGTERNMESKGSVIRDDSGKVSQVIVVSRDVTEDKKLAAQALRSQRMESIGTLAGGIAHDLNNVLSPIIMAIDLLRSKVPDQGSQAILGTLEASAKRGADIVRQVLAFGRGVKSERIPVQISHLILEVAKIAEETFPKSISVRTAIERNLSNVLADPTQMHQVLLNLCVNARDAMPRGGTLTIAAQNVTLDEMYARMHLAAHPGDYVSVVVTDTGTGIPTDIREHIFEPFFTTKEIGAGTGLGLSTALAIVKSHAGFFDLQSEPGKGTTFGMFIPAMRKDALTDASLGFAALPRGNGEMVLVIDDEASIREITKETLEAYGYEAITAKDGAEGIDVFTQNKEMIKAVIMDIMMPVIDGTTAILVLRKIDPRVRIIAASGLTAMGSIKPPPASSVCGFLTKPYTTETLLTALAAAIKGKAP